MVEEAAVVVTEVVVATVVMAAMMVVMGMDMIVTVSRNFQKLPALHKNNSDASPK